MSSKKHLSHILISISLFFVGLIIIWPTVENYFTEDVIDDVLPFIKNTLLKIDYVGKNLNGDCYKIKAKKIEDLGDQQYHIYNPDIEIIGIKGLHYCIISDEMIYDRKQKTAHFKGHVHLKNNDGLNMTTPSAIVYIDQNFAEGEEPVECIRGQSKIKAVGFKITGDNGQLEFKSQAVIESIQ